MEDQTPTESPTARLASFFAPPEVAETEQPAPEVETEEVTAQADEDEEPPPPEEAEGEEFEDDGEKYQLPPKLAAKVKEWRDGSLRQQDYTQKTQNLSAVTKQLSTIVEVAQTNEKFEQDIAPQKGELAQIKHQLAQFKSVDWGSLEVSQHLALRAQMENLKDRASELQQEIDGKKTQLREYHESKKQEVIKAGKTYLTQNLKGWNEKSEAEVVSRGRDLGFTDEELNHMLDARIVRAIYESSQFQKQQAAKASVMATVQKAPPVVKPGAVSTNQAAQRDKVLRQRLKASGKQEDAAALLKKFF